MMEIIEFFFSGPQWFLHFACLWALCYALSPTIEKNYYYDRDSDDTGGGKKTTALENDTEVQEE